MHSEFNVGSRTAVLNILESINNKSSPIEESFYQLEILPHLENRVAKCPSIPQSILKNLVSGYYNIPTSDVSDAIKDMTSDGILNLYVDPGGAEFISLNNEIQVTTSDMERLRSLFENKK